MATFVKVARVDDVPLGKMKTVNVNGQPVVLANVDGTIYAFSGICSHADGPLGRGKLLGAVVECPFHGGQFEVSSGKAVTPPATDDVATFAAQIEGDDIWVALPWGPC
jgi:3-phenylpropionate/trans-cinnamate dioxygenase ferredoxin component